MPSVDRLFEETISFVKRFLGTFLSVVFKPVVTLKNILSQEDANGINHLLFLLISLLLFLNIQLIPVDPRGLPFFDLLNQYEQKLTDRSFAERTIYVFPMAGIVYVTIALISCLFGRKKDKKRAFRQICYYWIACSCLLCIGAEFLVKLLSFYFSNTPPAFFKKYQNVFVAIQLGIFFSCQLASFVLPLIAVSKNIFNDSRFKLIFYIMPVISLFSVPILKYLTVATIGLLHLDRPQNIDISSPFGTNQFTLQVDSLKYGSSSTRVRFDALLKNNTERTFYIDSSSIIDAEKLNKDLQKSHDLAKRDFFHFKISSINGNKLAGATILRPDDLWAISLEAIADHSLINDMPFANKYVKKENLQLVFGLLDISDKKGSTFSTTENIEVYVIDKSFFDILKAKFR